MTSQAHAVADVEAPNDANPSPNAATSENLTPVNQAASANLALSKCAAAWNSASSKEY